MSSSPKTSWRDYFLNWIEEQERNHLEMTRDELRIYCKREYPLANREGWAYKVYLDVMREKFGDLRIQREAERAGQMDLFQTS